MLGGVLIVVLVGAMWLWMRRIRVRRQRWERRLSLPGEWRCSNQAERTVLRLMGRNDSGTYVQKRRGDVETVEEHGRWRLRGASLYLQKAGEPARQYELRLFEDGSIGIDGPDRPHWVLRRVSGGNVVPLRAVH